VPSDHASVYSYLRISVVLDRRNQVVA
jgi:hypothetical protein